MLLRAIPNLLWSYFITLDMMILSTIQGPTRCGNCTNLLNNGQCLDGIVSSTILDDITVELSSTTLIVNVPVSATPIVTNSEPEGLGMFNNCTLIVTNIQ